MTARIKKALPKKYDKPNQQYSNIKSHLMSPDKAKKEFKNNKKALICGGKNQNDDGYCKIPVELCAANSTKVSPYFKEQKRDDKNNHTCELIKNCQSPRNVPPTHNVNQPHNIYLNDGQIKVTIPHDPFDLQNTFSGTTTNAPTLTHTESNLPLKNHNVGNINKVITRHHQIKELREIVDLYIEKDGNDELRTLVNNFIDYNHSESHPNCIYYSTSCDSHTWYADANERIIYTRCSTKSDNPEQQEGEKETKQQYIDFLITEDQFRSITDDTDYDFENSEFYLFSVCQIRAQFKNKGFNKDLCLIDLTDQKDVEKYLYIINPNRDINNRLG